MKHFIDGDIIAFDTETTGLRAWHGDMPFAFAFYNLKGEAAYFEFEVDPFTRRVDISSREARLALEQVRHLLEDETVTKVMHNAKFDVRICERAFGIQVAGPGGPLRLGGKFHETMFMSWMCDSDEINYKLKDLAAKYIGIDRRDQDELKKCVGKLRRRAKKLGWSIAFDIDFTPEGEKQKPATEADYWLPSALHKYHPELATFEETQLCRTYAIKDVERTILLYCFYSKLMEELGVQASYEKEMTLWSETYRMEERGVPIRPALNMKEKREAAAKWHKYYEEVEKQSWPGINPDSPDQLRKLLYNDLQLPVNEEFMTDGGKSGIRKPGTSVDALAEMEHVPVVRSITKYRSSGKAFAYFAKYEKFALPDPEFPGVLIIHADFRQLGPSTGRFSCADPNLQQVTSRESSRSADPIDCRGPFGPRPGYVWLSVDYKGMEVRVYADCAQDTKMLEKIATGVEVHDEVTNNAWGGYGNQYGINECIHVLGLDGSEHMNDPQVVKYWQKIGLLEWDSLDDTDRRAIAEQFLAEFEWDIVKAQASLAKKVTKNKAKMVFFNKVYGGGPRAVKKLLRCPYHEARDLLLALDRTYPRIQGYMDELSAYARKEGCIWNRWGRRLTVPWEVTYKAVNYMVQGSSADLLKSAMIKCGPFFRQNAIDAHLIMTIHDELIFEVRRDELTKRLVRDVQGIMEDTEGCLNITMPTDPSLVIRSWNDKDKIKLDKVAA